MEKLIEAYPNYTVDLQGIVTNVNTKHKIKQTVKQGRLMVELWKDNKKKHQLVHRLIAQAFIPNTHNKPQINHIDGNPLNNNIENLEWVTDSENKYHAHRTGLINNRKTPVMQYTKEGEFIAEHRSVLDAYKSTKVDRKSIHYNIKNIYNHAGGFVWKKKI